MGLKKSEQAKLRESREQRILEFMTQDPPMAFANILKAEGLSDSFARKMIYAIEKKHGIKYFGTAASRMGQQPPIGLTEATFRLRSRLANELYKVVDKPANYGLKGREELGGRIGMNAKAQGRALVNPYDHDWSLSQIERLAKLIGEEPWNFLQRCLST